MSKKLRRVEFGEIGAILQQSRVLLDNLQYKVAITIMRMRNETAHAQCTRLGTKLHSWPQELCTDSYGSREAQFPPATY